MGRATATGKPSSNKRAAVLSAAVRCFAADGLNGTGMRAIARAAGLTEGTLYHYFASKDALIDAAFRWSAFDAASVSAAMGRKDAPLRERLLAVGIDFLAALRRRPEWTRVVIREALRGPSEAGASPVRGVLIPLAAERTRVLVAVLRGEMAARRIRRCDPRPVADHFFQALIGHFVAEAIARAQRAPRSAADPFVVHLVETIVTYLERPARPAAAVDRRRRRIREGRP